METWNFNHPQTNFSKSRVKFMRLFLKGEFYFIIYWLKDSLTGIFIFPVLDRTKSVHIRADQSVNFRSLSENVQQIFKLACAELWYLFSLVLLELEPNFCIQFTCSSMLYKSKKCQLLIIMGAFSGPFFTFFGFCLCKSESSIS